MTPTRAIGARMALIPADRQTDGSVGSLSLGDNVTLRMLDSYQSRLRLNRARCAPTPARCSSASTCARPTRG